MPVSSPFRSEFSSILSRESSSRHIPTPRQSPRSAPCPATSAQQTEPRPNGVSHWNLQRPSARPGISYLGYSIEQIPILHKRHGQLISISGRLVPPPAARSIRCPCRPQHARMLVALVALRLSVHDGPQTPSFIREVAGKQLRYSLRCFVVSSFSIRRAIDGRLDSFLRRRLLLFQSRDVFSSLPRPTGPETRHL